MKYKKGDKVRVEKLEMEHIPEVKIGEQIMNKHFETEDVIELYKIVRESIFIEIDKTNPSDKFEVVKTFGRIENQLREDLEKVFNLIYMDYIEEKNFKGE